MSDKQSEDSNKSVGLATGKGNINHEDNEQGERAARSADKEDRFTAGNQTPEIATNDGSVIETLDTAFHGNPGWSEGENISGSNRADYYEARSNGKSDVEEELDELRKKNEVRPYNDGKAS